ncbi:MAG: phospholipase D family protein [Acidimicrobiaceae bacterium]|nr:phospholipase D family protein [Acidimicrobiaceae bacterium]
MLQPANRLTLIDAMRPPAGFRLESAMAVTFTLNLRALLAVPAALSFTGAALGSPDREDPLDKPESEGDATLGSAGGNPSRGRERLEPVELIHALRSHAGKLTVFSQAGEIALPASQKIFAFLERSVVAVTAPRHGIVHPKVWVIRYEPAPQSGRTAEGRAGAHRLRVLVSSRNLGFDESWDTLVRLDESAGTAGASLEPVGSLFEGLLETAVSEVSLDHRQRVRSLAVALRTAVFALPEGVDELHAHVLGLPDNRQAAPLPTEAQRSLIISPFVSDAFFSQIQPSRIDELVSRQESLDSLKSDSLSGVTKAYTFDDRGVREVEDQEDRLSPLDPGRPLVGLHAKVFAFEDADRARLFLGSANATGPAFASNVEILLELIGSKAVLGIDRLCEGAGENTDEDSLAPASETNRRSEEPSLRDLFIPYVAGEPPGPGRDGGASLDGLRRKIAMLNFSGRIATDSERDGAAAASDRPDASRGRWSVTYSTTEPVPGRDGVSIRCWPLASAGNRQQVHPGEPLEARFETSLENISGFLAFELAGDTAEKADDDTAGNLSRFVVPVALEGLPEERDRLLLRMLIGNAERFLRYLVALLDEDSAESSLRDIVERISDRPGAAGGADDAGLSRPVLENLLSAMRRDPAKLAGIHPLVSDLADEDVLPPGFAELWGMIHDVATAGNPGESSS